MDKSDKDEEVILLCGNPRAALPGSVEETCADCGCAIVRMPDPDVPDTAVKLCVPCGLKRVKEHEEDPIWHITKANEELLHRLGWRLKKGTVN